MCTITFGSTFTRFNGELSDATISGNVVPATVGSCKNVIVSLADGSGVFATATVSVSAAGNFSAFLVPNHPVKCNTAIIVTVSCLEDPDCRLVKTPHFLCYDCPSFTTSIQAGDCDGLGNRSYTITINVTTACNFTIGIPGGTPIHAVMSGPGAYPFTVSLPASVSGTVTIPVNVTNPDGCPGIEIPVPVTKCEPPCPTVAFGTPSFGECTPDGNRIVTGTIAVTGSGTFSYAVKLDGNVVGNVDNANPGYSYNFVVAGSSSHSLTVDVPQPCADGVFTIEVPTCDFKSQPCPDLTVTPTFGDCLPNGTRPVSITVSATGTPGYVGSVSLDGGYVGPVSDGAPLQLQPALGGGVHVIEVAAVSPASCGTSIFNVDVPHCEVVDTTNGVGDPKIPCVICKKCQDYLTKVGKSIWGIIACKLLMSLLVAAICAGFSQAASGFPISSNQSNVSSWVLLVFGFTGFLWWYLLKKNCGSCCVYCAILWGVILGLIVAVIVLYEAFSWKGVGYVIMLMFLLLIYNESQVKDECDKSL